MIERVGWIDVHHHSYHPQLVTLLRECGVTQMAPGVPLPTWRPADSFRVMDRNGLSAAVLSVLLPDLALQDRRAAELVRRSNEWSAELVQEHAGRLGAFAVLPLPDIDTALAEITYAFDVLDMDGVVMSASLADGRLLGDPGLNPVFEELNRRRAVVFIHPNPSYHCSCTGNPDLGFAVPPPLVDFVMDTTRAVADLLFRGTLRRYHELRFILAHAGGAIPYLASRLELAATWVLAGNRHADRKIVRAELSRLYFETAQAAGPGTLACLWEVAGKGHILFGTDFPFMKDAVVAATRRGVEEYRGASIAAIASIGRDNALELFPRLRI
ncbi:MAG: amidohydrolase family protein [Pseudonocardiaceae bacterium]